jgi:hypothetical protein
MRNQSAHSTCSLQRRKPAICQQNGQIPEIAHTRHIIQICALTNLEAEGVTVAGAESGGLEDEGLAGGEDSAETGDAEGFGATGGDLAGTRGGGGAGFGTAGFGLSPRTSISEYRTSAAGAAWQKEANRRVAATDEIRTRIAVIVNG